MLAPGPRTVTAAFRVMGLALERRFTNCHRVLNWATWSVHQGSRILLGLLLRPTCHRMTGTTTERGRGALLPPDGSRGDRYDDGTGRRDRSSAGRVTQ